MRYTHMQLLVVSHRYLRINAAAQRRHATCIN
jgi:hypothetical protein